MERDLHSQQLYVAQEEDGVTGFITIHRKSGTVAEISWLGMRDDRQHTGIGSSLLNRAVHDLRRDSYQLLEVKTLEKIAEYEPYKRTYRFYQHAGFHSLEVIHPYPGWREENPCEIYVRVL